MAAVAAASRSAEARDGTLEEDGSFAWRVADTDFLLIELLTKQHNF